LHSGYFADPQAINILKRWVSSEYVRYQASREDISLSEKVELISQAQTIELKSWGVRGKPERMVFRIEVVPNSAQPPNTPKFSPGSLFGNGLGGINTQAGRFRYLFSGTVHGLSIKSLTFSSKFQVTAPELCTKNNLTVSNGILTPMISGIIG
jgi:hypothetical protein